MAGGVLTRLVSFLVANIGFSSILKLGLGSTVGVQDDSYSEVVMGNTITGPLDFTSLNLQKNSEYRQVVVKRH